MISIAVRIGAAFFQKRFGGENAASGGAYYYGIGDKALVGEGLFSSYVRQVMGAREWVGQISFQLNISHRQGGVCRELKQGDGPQRASSLYQGIGRFSHSVSQRANDAHAGYIDWHIPSIDEPR